MDEVYSEQQFFADLNTRLRDLEEKQRLIKERVLLVGQTLIEERDRNFKDIQEMKRTIFQLKEDNKKAKELLLRITEQLGGTVRKEELMILQRQFDLFREK